VGERAVASGRAASAEGDDVLVHIVAALALRDEVRPVQRPSASAGAAPALQRDLRAASVRVDDPLRGLRVDHRFFPFRLGGIRSRSSHTTATRRIATATTGGTVIVTPAPG